MSGINVNELAEAINDALVEYSTEVDNYVQDKVEKKAKEIHEYMKTHPNVKKLKGRGKYKKGFKLKEESKKMGYRLFRIKNTEYQLTHLLEYGHEIFVGKTKPAKNTGKPQIHTKGGRTKAFPHWQDGERKAKEFYDEMMGGLGK